MIKNDIIQALYEEHGGMSLSETQWHVDNILLMIKTALREGDTVTVAHFGRFEVIERRGREIIMPDGKKVYSKEETRVRFRPSSTLKKRINQEVRAKREADLDRDSDSEGLVS